MGALMVRRRTGLPRDACVLVAARGRYEGLLLPGTVSAGTRWHARLDVVLLPGELRVAGNGGLWRYPVADMVLATSDPATGAVRVDFLEGEPLVVRVRDGGALLAGLGDQIEQYERALRSDGHLTMWLVRDHLTGADLEASVQALTPAIGLLHARRAVPPEHVPTCGWATDSGHAAHRARVDARRAGRRDLLELSRVSA
jgi:hypothetical protein